MVKQRGLTLLEMLVALSIMSAVMMLASSAYRYYVLGLNLQQKQLQTQLNQLKVNTAWQQQLASTAQYYVKNGDVNVRQRTGRKALASSCSVDGCELAGPYTRGWCPSHYGRWQRWGDPLGTQTRPPVPCSVDGCDRDDYAKGLCNMHYNRAREHGEPGEPTPRRRAAGEGHTDSSGDAAANVGLSQKRAIAVRLALITRGVPQAMLRAQGYGAAQPIADNTTDEGKALNRRTTITWSE